MTALSLQDKKIHRTQSKKTGMGEAHVAQQDE